MIDYVGFNCYFSFLHYPKKKQKTLALDCSPTHYFLNSAIQRTRFAQTALYFFRIFEKRVPGCHSRRAEKQDKKNTIYGFYIAFFVKINYTSNRRSSVVNILFNVPKSLRVFLIVMR
jgi:hypothetical protein